MTEIAVVVLLASACHCAIGATDPCRPDQSAPKAFSGYRLAWSDEFRGRGAPSKDTWNFEKGYVRNHEAQYYTSGNARVRDGVLVIEARKERVRNERFGDQSLLNGPHAWKARDRFSTYTSASMTTRGKREFKYGRVLVRARIPTAKGAWPAIWTLGVEHDWPSCGEIDMLEYYRANGGHGEPIILANACWSSSSGQWNAKWDSVRTPFRKFTDADPKWAEKFHVWRMDWDEKSVKLFLDDQLLNEIDCTKALNEGGWGNHWKGNCPFTQPHYLILNLALGGDNGGPIDDSAFPMRYEVDYVRVYERVK